MKTTQELEEIYDSEPYEWIALWKNRGVWVKITNPNFIHGCHYQLIHVIHEHILEAYLADSSVIVEVVEEVIPNWIQPNFIENYNPDLEYQLKEDSCPAPTAEVDEYFNSIEEIKIRIDKKVLSKLKEIAEVSMVSVSDIIESEIYKFIGRREYENDRLSSDIDTTVDSDNIVSKMTIPIIEVDEEMDREIDEYLSKQDGCREVRMVTCNGLQFGTEENEDEHHESELDLDTFNERGFNTPDFEGKILQKVKEVYIGYVIDNNEVFSKLWSLEGICSQGELWNLDTIKKHWYDTPANFPVRLIRDTEYCTTYRWVYDKDNFISSYNKGFRLVTEDECTLVRSMF